MKNLMKSCSILTLAAAMIASMPSAHADEDCKSLANDAVKAVLKVTGSLKSRKLEYYSTNIIPASQSSNQAFDITYADPHSDEYVHYNVEVEMSNGHCDIVTKVDLAGEE